MNISIKHGVIALAALALAACAGSRVATDYDGSARFDTLQTFAWLDPVVDDIEDPVLDSQLLTRKVQRSVADALLQRGYSRTESAVDADFLVTYHTASRERLRDRGGFSIGLGIGRPWRHGYGSVYMGDSYFPRIEGYQEGTLIIDILDADTRDLLWRGWVRNTVDARNYTDEAIAAAVAEIIAEFPPGYVPPEV
ncbi:MAG: DUF4136 domain-containing protein [Gammaproteobacteria bacterium]